MVGYTCLRALHRPACRAPQSLRSQISATILEDYTAAREYVKVRSRVVVVVGVGVLDQGRLVSGFPPTLRPPHNPVLHRSPVCSCSRTTARCTTLGERGATRSTPHR